MVRWIRLVAVALLLHGASVDAEEVDLYKVSLTSDLKRMDVEVCFAGEVPPVLHAGYSFASRFLESPELSGSGRVFTEGNRLRLRGAERGACLRYGVDIEGAIAEHEDRRLQRVGNDLVASPWLWLWRPKHFDQQQLWAVEFDLPAGVSASVPWAREVAEGKPRYRLAADGYDWPVVTAFGRFDALRLVVAESEVEAAVLGEPPAMEPERVRGWLQHALHSLLTLYGRLPQSRIHVLIYPSSSERNEPFPWASVLRGGGATAQFWVKPALPQQRFEGDWTPVHELVHLTLPFVNQTQPWLTEGIATYYQNVLRARSGSLSQKAAWQEMVDGFARAADRGEGRSLRAASLRMDEEGLHQRVYWAGAALVLMIDARLRHESEGGNSLDRVLSKLQACCLPSDRLWNAHRLVDLFDRLGKTGTFSAVVSDWLDESRFPDVRELLRRLGVEITGGRVTRLDDGAPWAPVRRAIMAPANAAATESASLKTVGQP